MSPFKPVTIHARRGVVVIVAVAFFLAPIAAWVGASRVNENRQILMRQRATDARQCVRIHRIVTVGGEIIAAGRASLLVQIDVQLSRWYSADCPPRKR